MTLPTKPGAYVDARGDIWLLHVDGRWQHVERRLSDGSGYPVRDYSPVPPDVLEELAQEPNVAVLPLTPVQVPDCPPDES
ncbi:hypothetical protein [Nocardia sp. CC227C]|uniref:hypothetical protein n=1 Tax=Nocardia sp. CC227C TaxID=3044562 RepID=UPI00278BFD6A|nr:hypothetical protein [Nocardia sp. CC227C]